MSRVGFVGLGVMGEPMAGHLLAAGVPLTVWNRTASKADSLGSKGAMVSSSLASLAQQCSTIITCVGKSEDVRDVVMAMSEHASKGTLFVDHSTIEPSVAQELQESLTTKGLRFVDAPITGGSMGAQNGTLTVFCGGPEADVVEAMTVIAPYTKRAERVGESGSGQMMKLANQIAVGGALVGLCESLAFAQKAGLNVEQAHGMIGGGAGGSWAFTNYGAKILNRDWSPGFSVKNQRKDFGYCELAASDLGLDVPMTALVNELLSRLEKAGRGEETTAALFDVYSEKE